jgi:hypothetical protein
VEALSGELAEQLADVDDALAKLDAGTMAPAIVRHDDPRGPPRGDALGPSCIDCASQRR